MKRSSVEYVKQILADEGKTYVHKIVLASELDDLLATWENGSWTEIHIKYLGDRRVCAVGYKTDVLGPAIFLVEVYHSLMTVPEYTPEVIVGLVKLKDDVPDKYLDKVNRSL
jgi:hypothetical protein